MANANSIPRPSPMHEGYLTLPLACASHVANRRTEGIPRR
jgi:hypothetical protein